MIQDSWPKRPIYFARTSGSYAKQLGLGDNVITQGLAAKLFLPPTGHGAPGDSLYLQGDGWLDVATSDSLWQHTFVGPKSVLNTGDWIDRPSVGIPYLYVATGIELAEALKTQGKTAQANSTFNTAKQVATAVRLDDLLRGAEQEFNQMTDTGGSGAAARRDSRGKADDHGHPCRRIRQRNGAKRRRKSRARRSLRLLVASRRTQHFSARRDQRDAIRIHGDAEPGRFDGHVHQPVGGHRPLG